MRRLKLRLFSLLLIVNTVSTQTVCKNGGFPSSSTGNCNCPSFWTGTDCGTIECINGGYSIDKSCICPQGYLGVHCDAVTLIQAPIDQFDSNLPTFNLVYINLFSDYWGQRAQKQFQKAVNNHTETFDGYYEGGFNILYNKDFPKNKNLTQDITEYKFSLDTDIAAVLNNGIMYPKYYACYKVPVIDEIISQLIKAKQLSQTAITVLTQHPLDGDTTALVTIAQAFGIRINILWSDDDVFVRCGDGDIQGMKDLARQTGGLFISLTHDESDPAQSIIDALLMSHYAYQPTDFASSTNTLQMSFLAYPNPTQNYYLFTTGTLDTTGHGNVVYYGSVNMNAYFLPTLVMRNNFTINCTSVGDDCIGLVFTNDNDNTKYPLTVYSSFVEDVVVDTSNTQPDAGNPLHLALHIKNSGNSVISVSAATNYQNTQCNRAPLTMLQRDRATFEFISNETINCEMSTKEKTYKYWWITVVFNVAGGKMQRVIRYNCKPISPNFATSTAVPNTASTSIANNATSTVLPSTASSTVATSTVVTDSSITLSDILTTVTNKISTAGFTKPPAAPCAATTVASFEPLQFISGFADTVNQSIFNDFNVQTYQSASSIYQKFGMVRFEVTTNDVQLAQVDTYADYYTQAYINMTWNSALATQPHDNSQVLDAIKTLISKVSQNAFASFLVDKLPGSTFNIADYYLLVNRNVKLFMLMDAAAFTREVSRFKRNSYPLNTIAALTSGHFIVSDQYDQHTFRELLQLVHDNTAKQNLLISRNFQFGQQNLGELDLSQFSSDIVLTLTVTTEITDNWNANVPSTVNIAFNGKKAGNNKAITLNRTASSNFYSASVTLSPDTYTIVAKIQTTGSVYLRIWSPRNAAMSEVQVGYADLKDEFLSSPDADNGTAIRTYMYNNTFVNNTRIQIRDCTGNAIKLFDWDQSVSSTTCSSGAAQLSWSAFVPFFCIANADPQLSTCRKETTNLYTVQVSGVTAEGAYMASKSFICNPAVVPKADNAYLDPNNNYLCGGTTTPYTRGPTCHLRECSGFGLLYNASLSINADYAPYQCECGSKAIGESCEQGVCPQKNEDPGTSDSVYRTLTVVVGADQISGNLASYALQEAFLAISLLTAKDNIWQYQLILQCSSGDVFTIYIGSSFNAFTNKFNNSKIDCPNSDSPSLNMQTMFNYATAAVGRSQKGMIVFYNENPELITVNKTELVRYTQQYRQEIHLLTVVESDTIKDSNNNLTTGLQDMISVTFSTGGTFIIGELGQDTFEPIPVPLYDNLLGSSVSYNLMDPQGSDKDSYSVYIEGSADVAYLVAAAADSITVDVVPAAICTSTDGVTNTLYRICTLAKGTAYTITTKTLGKSIWSTVIVVNGITPMTAILEQRNDDDRQTAFAVDYIDAGPIIGYQLPTGMAIQNSNDKKLRISSRTDCTYSTTSYSISDPVTPIMKLLQIGINTTPMVTKFLPIAVSSAVVCQNGGTARDDIGACYCPTGFTGADCGQVTCDDGVISTWGSACNCRDQLKSGRNCAQEKPVMSSLFATW